MAQVSPKQPPGNAGLDNDSLPPDFEDFPFEDSLYLSQDAPVDVDEPRPGSREAPEQTQQASPIGGIAGKVDTFDDSMLLARPNLSFRTQELGRDFNYGPATAISAANFTKSSHRSAPIQQHKKVVDENSPAQTFRPIASSNKPNRSPLAENAEPVVEKGQGKKSSDHLAPLVQLKKLPSPQHTTQQQVDDAAVALPKNRNDALVSTMSHHAQGPLPVPSVPIPVRTRVAEASIDHSGQLYDHPVSSHHHHHETNASKSLSSTREYPPEPRKQHSRQGSGRIISLPLAEEEQDGDGTRPHKSEVEQKNVPGLRNSRHAPSSNAGSSRGRPIHHATHPRGPAKHTDMSRHSKTIVFNHGNRPPSRSSNVSRPRAVPQQRHTSQMSELPSELCAESVAPSPDVRQKTLVIDHDFTSSMADVINKYTQHHKTAINWQMAKYDKYIKRLKFQRSEGKKELEKCASQIEAQARTIQELQDREASMAEQIKSHERESAMAEARTQQIEDKYYMIKGFLNSAIEEQQHLYNKAKKQCEDSVIEIRALKESSKSAMELAIAEAETARIETLKKVNHVVTEAKVEAEGLREQINSADQRLREKTAELEQQQNENRVLSEKLQNVKSETNGLESLVAQNKEILEKLDEQHTAASKKTKEVEEETQAKFDALNQEIKALLKLLAGQPLELINIQNSNKELADCITTKANEMAWCQSVTEESTGKFFTDIENLVKQVLEHLNQQNQNAAQELSKVTEDCGALSLLVKMGESSRQELEAEIDAWKEDADKKEKEIQDLDEKLFYFQTTEMELKSAQQQVLSAQMDRQRLEDEVQSKATRISSLEEVIREKNEAHTSEVSKLAENLTKLNQVVRDKEESSRVAIYTATELARREMRIEMEKAAAEAKKALRLVEMERDAVAADVETLKRDLRISEDKTVHDAHLIDSLNNNLAATESRLENLTDEVKQRTTDLEELRAQETATIKALEERISSVEKTAAGRLGETRHLLAVIQQFVVALRKWSEWGPLPVEVKRLLGDFEIDPPDSQESDAIFPEILEKITAVIRTQQPPAPVPEMVTQDGSSSRYFPGNNILPDLRSPQQFESGAGENRTFGNHLSDHGQGRVQALMQEQRRVEVRSPALGLQPEPSPPSIQQEKDMRREAPQPKPIMKRGSLGGNRGAARMLVDEVSEGEFTRQVDEVEPQGSASSSQQQGLVVPSGQQETGNPDWQLKGKKLAGRAPPKSNSKAPQKSHESTVPSKRKSGSGLVVPSKRKSGPGETGNKAIRIKKSALTLESQQSQQSSSSQDLPAGNGFGPRPSVEHGLSPPDSHPFSQRSWDGGLASQSQGLTRTGRTYGTRNAQKDSLMTGLSQGHSQSQREVMEVDDDDDDPLVATQDNRQKRPRTGSKNTDSEGPGLLFPKLAMR